MKKLLFLLALLFASPALAQFADQRQYAPTSGGSANIQTVAIPNYSLNVGVVVRFIPGFANTGPTTLSVNGGVAKVVLKPTLSGLAALTGGEVQAGQVSEVLYDGTQYELLNASAPLFGPGVTSLLGGAASGTGGPVGSINPTITGLRANSISATTSVVHQAQGGLMTMNGNAIWNADYFEVATGDGSLYTWATATGTPTTGETPGLDWTVGGVLFQVRFTVPSGATNAIIANGICAAVVGNASLLAALAAAVGGDGLGYQPVETGCVNQVAGATFEFDQPFAVSGNSVVAHTRRTLP